MNGKDVTKREVKLTNLYCLLYCPILPKPDGGDGDSTWACGELDALRYWSVDTDWP